VSKSEALLRRKLQTLAGSLRPGRGPVRARIERVRTMLGKIDRMRELRTKNGQKYLVLSIDGKNYSLWDDRHFGRLAEGDVVAYQWKQSGDYRHITEIEVQERAVSQANAEKDGQIVRMSCLKSASTILANLEIDPEEKIDLTINTARKFEKYITGNDNGEPGA